MLQRKLKGAVGCVKETTLTVGDPRAWAGCCYFLMGGDHKIYRAKRSMLWSRAWSTRLRKFPECSLPHHPRSGDSL